jgi:hypothetical protein
MPNAIRYIKQRIRELQRDLDHLRADERKQYWREYYLMHREKKLAEANARNYRAKNALR